MSNPFVHTASSMDHISNRQLLLWVLDAVRELSRKQQADRQDFDVLRTAVSAIAANVRDVREVVTRPLGESTPSRDEGDAASGESRELDVVARVTSGKRKREDQDDADPCSRERQPKRHAADDGDDDGDDCSIFSTVLGGVGKKRIHVTVCRKFS